MDSLRATAIRVIAVAFSAYALFEAITLKFPPFQERALFLLFPLALAFLMFPLSKRFPARWMTVPGALLAAVACLYVFFFYQQLMARVGDPTTLDLVLGTGAMILVLEGTRRCVGWALPLLALAMIGYAAFGYYLPESLAAHGGYDWSRIVGQSYTTMEGIFGLIIYVTFYYIFLFVLFGAVLEATGAGQFLMDLAKSLFGRFSAGPAKVAVLASGLMGSISGSAVANVVTTGTFTIPLMKRVGFEPKWAGAVEAVASSGGALMPPVMGAAAFLMAEFLSIPYAEICKAAIFPALLYYGAVFAAVHAYGKKRGLKGLPPEELGSARKILWDWRGVIFFAAVGVLVTLLVRRYSPTLAVLSALPVMFVLSLFKPETRLTPRRILGVLEKAGKDMVILSCSAACVGIIMGLILMTGLGNRFTGLILDVAGGNLVLVLFLTMICSLILGMGLPTTVCYVLLATLIAPALIAMGITPLAAHMFIFYFGMISMVTPPVAMAAYAGATVARAPVMATAFVASRLAITAFILPYMFVYSPALLLEGHWPDVVLAMATSSIGIVALSSSVVGYFRGLLPARARVILFVTALLLIKPGIRTDFAGLALLAGTALWVAKRRRAEKPVVQIAPIAEGP
ncbi:MAG: TRAP transporter permease [Acidobacteria bacterium]|nr:TRAP transporter permease [Acidobacteriota bacterium]